MNNKERDAEIARLRSEGVTLQEISSRYGLSREGIRQIVKRQGVIIARSPKTARTPKPKPKMPKPLRPDEMPPDIQTAYKRGSASRKPSSAGPRFLRVEVFFKCG